MTLGGSQETVSASYQPVTLNGRSMDRSGRRSLDLKDEIALLVLLVFSRGGEWR
jgi:hypothetical protein